MKSLAQSGRFSDATPGLDSMSFRIRIKNQGANVVMLGGKCEQCGSAVRYRTHSPEPHKRGQEPIVRSTLRAIWLLVPDPFSWPGHI